MGYPFYILHRGYNLFRILYVTSQTEYKHMWINTKDTFSDLILKSCHHGNDQDEGHYSNGNTSDRYPSCKGNECFFPF